MLRRKLDCHPLKNIKSQRTDGYDKTTRLNFIFIWITGKILDNIPKIYGKIYILIICGIYNETMTKFSA